jgi:hypothetical protein
MYKQNCLFVYPTLRLLELFPDRNFRRRLTIKSFLQSINNKDAENINVEITCFINMGPQPEHKLFLLCFLFFQLDALLSYVRTRFWLESPEGKRPPGRPRHRWEDGIIMDLREIGLGSVDWIRLA